MSRQKGIGRGLGLLVAVALLGGGGSAVAQSGATWEALESEYPGVVAVERRERIAAVFGRPMTTGSTAREAMEDWMDLYQPVFGVEELEWAETRGAEISRERVAFALRQQVTVEGGILTEPTPLPVEGGRLRALVAPDGADFAVTYVAARVVNVDGGIAAPQITGQQAIAAAEEDERTQHLEVWSEPELVVVEMDLGAGPEVFAAWRLEGMESQRATETAMIVHIDAVTAGVVSVGSGVAYGVANDDSVTGVVKGGATAGLGPPIPASAAEVPLAEVLMQIPNEYSTRTDSDGLYQLEALSPMVEVWAILHGGWFWVYDHRDDPPLILREMQTATPPATVNFTFNPVTPAAQADTAPINLYRHILIADAFMDEWVANWPTIRSGLPPIKAIANFDEGQCEDCGASGLFSVVNSEIKTCAETDDCNNGGYSTVITHEYGHYIAHNIIEATLPDHDGFHEGYAFAISMLVNDTPTYGYAFRKTGSPAAQPGLSTRTYPECVGSEHARGEVLARIWWDIRLDIDPPLGQDPLEATRQLFADWTMLTSGSAEPVDPCDWLDQSADLDTLIEVLTADDDDSDLSNGTPNGLVICKAFSDRGIDSPPGLGLCPLPLHGGEVCRADINYDGVLDIYDFLEFQNMFAKGDMFADFTEDGQLDFFDFMAFQSEMTAGCSQAL